MVLHRAVAPAVSAVLVLGGCSSPRGTGGAQPIEWIAGEPDSANGPAPEVSVFDACGSDHATYLRELLDTPAFALTVQREWGDAAPGGKQLMVSGRIAWNHLGPTDLPISHPFGD